MTGDEAPILQRISAHYFATMKIPLIRGRVWSDSESAGTPHVAVVNQTMARACGLTNPRLDGEFGCPITSSHRPFRLAAPGSDGWFEISRCCRRHTQCRSP